MECLTSSDTESTPIFSARIRQAADDLAAALPSTLVRTDWYMYENLVRELQVINLRSEATRHLLDSIGVGKAPQEFTRRALFRLEQFANAGAPPVGLLGAGIDTTRAFAYAEYDVVQMEGSSLQLDGHVCRESGLRGSTAAGRASPWLHSFRLPNSSHVERSLCAEFQILRELCCIFVPGSVAEGCSRPHQSLVGVLILYTSTSPCLSCLGAIRQFQLLFPEIALETSEHADAIQFARLP